MSVASIPPPSTIRAKAKHDKATVQQTTAAVSDRSRMDKEVVKAVLASPLSVPWLVYLC